MEPQNQVRVETLFPVFCFQLFWRFSYVDDMGGHITLPPKHESTVISGLRLGTNVFCQLNLYFC